MNAKSEQYIPGVCNIGPVEIVRRKNIGWLSLSLTLMIGALFIIYHVASAWRLFVFFPAAYSATGFLQAYMHFCARFGMQGVFNFGTELYKTTKVEEQEFKKADRKKALQIISYSVLIGIAVTIIICTF